MKSAKARAGTRPTAASGAGVDAVFDACPKQARAKLLALRRLTVLRTAVPLARLRLLRLLLARLGLWLRVLRELLRGRTVTARLTWVGVLRRLGRGCGHGRFL